MTDKTVNCRKLIDGICTLKTEYWKILSIKECRKRLRNAEGAPRKKETSEKKKKKTTKKRSFFVVRRSNTGRNVQRYAREG